ncbi:MAG: hypothetical protein NC350_00390 [Corallococcus sp.]|nr:hypothetical protein [Corallococcus sp.]
MTEKKSFGFKIKEFFRKLLVGLKRRPQNIALIVLLASFLTYSLNLTKFSNTTAEVGITPMGLCQFGIMLFSILAMVCFLNAFPKRQKPKIVMLVIMFVMIAAIIAFDVVYYIKVNEGVQNRLAQGYTMESIVEKYPYWFTAQAILIAQIVLLGIASLLIALLPVYGKLLKKINTSVQTEDNGKLDAIELETEE